MSLFKKTESTEEKLISKGDLEHALKKKEFVFYYQPEFDIKTTKIIAVEALMRWESSNGIVPPNQFIPVLEESGLIHKFTDFLFNQTLSDLKQIHEAGYTNVIMSVNLSASQLLDKNLISSISKALEKNLIKSEFLECEITESKKISFPLKKDVFKELENMNIPVAIDDFGTGFSTFSYLKNISVKKIKIDCEFIRNLEEDSKNKTIVSALIKLGHDLGISVVAEGVETTEQKEWLQKNGCDLGQGFWFSRAIPLEQLLTFLKNKK